MLRRLIRHPRTQAAAAAALGGYLGLVARTTRWTVLGEENLAAAVAAGPPPGPVSGFSPGSFPGSFPGPALGPASVPGMPRPGIIMAFWHERVAIMPLCWQLARRTLPPLRGARAHVLVSRHRDGRLIGEVAGRFALSMVHGSSSRGGAAGLIALARLLAAGEHVVITPDGPRGPRRRAAPGVAHLAALTGRPVLPCGAALSRARILRTWDRMALPLPFGRGVLVVGPPIAVPRRGAEAALPAIEAALGAACDRADAMAGVAPGAAAARAAPA